MITPTRPRTARLFITVYLRTLRAGTVDANLEPRTFAAGLAASAPIPAAGIDPQPASVRPHRSNVRPGIKEILNRTRKRQFWPGPTRPRQRSPRPHRVGYNRDTHHGRKKLLHEHHVERFLRARTARSSQRRSQRRSRTRFRRRWADAGSSSVGTTSHGVERHSDPHRSRSRSAS